MQMAELVDSGMGAMMTVFMTRSVFYFPFLFTCMQMETHNARGEVACQGRLLFGSRESLHWW